MSFAIVYQSATGNTALLAENIRGALPKEECLFSGSQLPKEKAGLLFVGFWTDKGDCACLLYTSGGKKHRPNGSEL